MKVFVEFDSVEQAAAAVAAVNQASFTALFPQAPVQQYAPQAPVQQFAPQQPQYAAPAAPVQQFAPQAPVPQAPTVTLKELTVAGQNYAKKHGAAQAKAVMAQFGIQKMTDTKPEQMASLFAALSV